MTQFTHDTYKFNNILGVCATFWTLLTFVSKKCLLWNWRMQFRYIITTFLSKNNSWNEKSLYYHCLRFASNLTTECSAPAVFDSCLLTVHNTTARRNMQWKMITEEMSLHLNFMCKVPRLIEYRKSVYRVFVPKGAYFANDTRKS